MDETGEEKIWISRCRDGDQAAFEALIRTHQQMIHALTYRMTGSLADCKDLAQEAFVRAYQQLDSYQGTAKFSSWLYRIAINACLDWQRQEKRRGQIYADWGESQITASNQSGPAVRDDELSRKVQLALLKLPAKQRAAIVLTVYEDRSHAEAAQILGCSETTVSWRIFTARRKLKRLLSAQGDRHE
jgi:RNA polymerase sigma-70 factor (ECF subfamily)